MVNVISRINKDHAGEPELTLGKLSSTRKTITTKKDDEKREAMPTRITKSGQAALASLSVMSLLTSAIVNFTNLMTAN